VARTRTLGEEEIRNRRRNAIGSMKGRIVKRKGK
jgi:ATP-dependent Lon protease